jgi:hypothetical protein
MNLENLNLVELNAQEVQETEGGKKFGLLSWGGLGVWYLLEWINNPVAHSKALSEGYNTKTHAWD